MLTSRIALFADIHGNSPALQAVLEDIDRQDCDEAFFLGDIVNGLDPHGCIQMLRGWSGSRRIRLTGIKGNAEMYLATPNLDALPIAADYNQDLIELIRWFERHTTTEDRAWLNTFPDSLRWQDAYLVHDSPLDRREAQQQPAIPPEYREWYYHGPGISPDTPEAVWDKLFAFIEEQKLSQVFCGHTHTAFFREKEGRIICNVGSVGAPLDGDPRPAWVMLEGQAAISICRAAYDVSLAHRLVDASPDYPDFSGKPGMSEAYKAWYATGIHWRAHLRQTLR